MKTKILILFVLLISCTSNKDLIQKYRDQRIKYAILVGHTAYVIIHQQIILSDGLVHYLIRINQNSGKQRQMMN